LYWVALSFVIIAQQYLSKKKLTFLTKIAS